MKKIKDCFFYATLTFTCLILFFNIIRSVVFTNTDNNFLHYENTVIHFLYSLSVGASFLVFELKKLPSAATRTIHILINYALMVVFVFGFTGKIKEAGMIFAATFIFIAVYVFCSLITKGLKKLDKFVKD